MNLQIDYLRTFTALADAKNFTKTGKQANLSQSAVSMQRKRLENKVGKKLIVLLSIAAALFLGVAAVNAQAVKGVELGDAVVITAEVVAVDKADRMLTSTLHKNFI